MHCFGYYLLYQITSLNKINLVLQKTRSAFADDPVIFAAGEKVTKTGYGRRRDKAG